VGRIGMSKTRTIRKGLGRKDMKVKSFSNETELRTFTKSLREKGVWYSYFVQEGNLEIPILGQQDLLEANSIRNRLHIVKYSL
jgi:hypothetical protein